MISKPSSCEGCVLEKLGAGFMRVDGEGRLGVMIVAESLGKEEVEKGVPLVGAAGFYVQRLLKKAEMDLRRDFFLANCVWCRPPENDVKPFRADAVSHCFPNLRDAILEKKPKVVLTFGDVALEVMTERRGIMSCRGYPVWNEEFQIWVVPTLHPSFVMRGNHKYAPVLLHDLRKAVEIAERGFSFEELLMIEDPSPKQFEEFVSRYEKALEEDASTTLAFDIETPYKRGKDEDDLDEEDPSYTILRCSFGFSDRAEDTVSIPWDLAFRPSVERMLGSNGTKLVWNGSYDVPRILAAGITINGEIRDSQIAWHVSHSALPKKLGFVATLCPSTSWIPMWKHLSSIYPAYYNALDSLVLHRLDTWVQKVLVDLGMDTVYNEQIKEIDPILARMTRAGMLIDPLAREKLRIECEEKAFSHLTAMDLAVPHELKPKIVWKKKKELPNVREIMIDAKVKQCLVCGMIVENKTAHQKGKGNPCKNGEIVKVDGKKVAWEETLPFTPSPKQLLAYAKYKHYPISLTVKEKRETMNSDAIERILKKHPGDPVFREVEGFRSAQKIGSTYVVGMPVKEDGRVHGYITHTPSTLRMAMVSPNLQNQPRPDPDEPDGIYTAVRNMFIAGPNMILGARDFSGIEAVLSGWFMEDPTFIRLAKLGIHAFLTSHIVGEPASLEWTDEELVKYFAVIKKKFKPTYSQAKKIVHLSNYGGTPAKIHMEEPELFPTIKDAAKIQDIYYSVAPRLPKWHYETCLRVEKNGYLRCPDGFMHRFTNLFRYEWDPYTKRWTRFNRSGKVMWGEDAKKALACGPQHMASVIMKAAIKILGRDERVAPWLRLTIHDELMWECPREKFDEVDEIVSREMERVCQHLPLPESWNMGPFLKIGTEGKKGDRWGLMK